MAAGNPYRGLISDRLAKYLTIYLGNPRPTTSTVSTASAATSLRILGEVPAPLCLKITQTGQKFQFLPAVAEHLAMEVNLSGPCTHKYSREQLQPPGRRLIANTRVQVAQPPHTSPTTEPTDAGHVH